MTQRFRFLKRRWNVVEFDAVVYSVVLAVILVAAAVANVVSRFSN